MKQPGLGIVATILVMAIALGFVSLFSFPTFAGWVAYYLLCVIPIQIVMAVTWGTEQPRAAARAPQPLRGLLLTLFALLVGFAGYQYAYPKLDEQFGHFKELVDRGANPQPQERLE